MARCPFATWDPVEVGSHERSIRPAGVVMHTAVSDSDALRPWSGIEWHFYVGRSGEITQFRDTEVEADAQMDGNQWRADGESRGHISIETWDGAGSVWDGHDVSAIPPWTDTQVEAIGRLLAWLHQEHGIPLERIQAWDGRGVGYHRQFTSNSSPRWNESHACPGDRRINQINDIIREAQNQEDDMPSAEEVAEAVWEYRFPNLSQGETRGQATARWFQQNIEEAQDKQYKDLRSRLNALEQAVGAIGDGLGEEVGQAVRDALAEATVDVNVHVQQGGEEE